MYKDASRYGLGAAFREKPISSFVWSHGQFLYIVVVLVFHSLRDNKHSTKNAACVYVVTSHNYNTEASMSLLTSNFIKFVFTSICLLTLFASQTTSTSSNYIITSKDDESCVTNHVLNICFITASLVVLSMPTLDLKVTVGLNLIVKPLISVTAPILYTFNVIRENKRISQP